MANRLAREPSLYLRQHGENPVDWYPWGEEALRRAREGDRPILLSIGYSSCHWCHVMERESFEDPGIARLMNEGFVCVKVDREERPDVDGIYMKAVQALTGQGGWPLTVFLTPEGEPFYGGTYFPPEPRHGMPSFPQLLEATGAAWREKREQVLEAAAGIREALERSARGPQDAPAGTPGALDAALVRGACRDLLRGFDPAHGGFGRAPKFPQPVLLNFLLEHHAVGEDKEALKAVLSTLAKMARGGIRDQLGGGFHRYSVDRAWLVPHFEKMLYDNALLARVYLRAWQLSADPALLRVTHEVLEDLLGSFRSPEGAFYTAWDADSEGEEGRFYLWTPGDLDEVLPEDLSRLFRTVYGVSREGHVDGRSVLHLPRDPDGVARAEGLTPEELEARLAEARDLLKAARERREPPLRDEKILAGWNGLTLRTFAEAGAALDEPRYLEAARRGATWLLDALRPDGRLLHQVPLSGAPDAEASEGPVRARYIPAFLDDVAAMGNALLSLHEATLEPGWLQEAIALDEEVEARFRDGDTALLHDTPADGEPLLIRPREVMDSPIPSGTSLAAELRWRLGVLLGDEDRIAAAHRIVAHEVPVLREFPLGHGHLLSVALRFTTPPLEVGIVGARDDAGTRALLREVHQPFLPNRIVTGREEGEPVPADTPLLNGRGLSDGRPAAYVCRGYACRAPVTDPAELVGELARA
jgi:uncharacterized protein